MRQQIVSEAVPPKNRITVCPVCNGSFLNDKDLETSERRFIYCERTCRNCYIKFYIKQGPEEITSPLCYHTEPTDNRLHICPKPECKETLSGDRSPYTSQEDSDRGFIYRNRICLTCGMDVHTKQPPEEVTGMERPLM